MSPGKSQDTWTENQALSFFSLLWYSHLPGSDICILGTSTLSVPNIQVPM